MHTNISFVQIFEDMLRKKSHLTILEKSSSYKKNQKNCLESWLGELFLKEEWQALFLENLKNKPEENFQYWRKRKMLSSTHENRIIFLWILFFDRKNSSLLFHWIMNLNFPFLDYRRKMCSLLYNYEFVWQIPTYLKNIQVQNFPFLHLNLTMKRQNSISYLFFQKINIIIIWTVFKLFFDILTQHVWKCLINKMRSS